MTVAVPTTRSIARMQTRPNGVTLSPDGKILYVGNERKILAYDSARSGSNSRNFGSPLKSERLQRHRVFGDELVQPGGRGADVMERFGPLDPVAPA